MEMLTATSQVSRITLSLSLKEAKASTVAGNKGMGLGGDAAMGFVATLLWFTLQVLRAYVYARAF